MGSQMSKEISTDQSNHPTNSSKKLDIKTLSKTESSLGNICNDNNSSYNGIINQNSKYSKNGQKSQENSFFDESLKKSVKFLWKEGGNEVLITGTFSDWKKKFKMHKNSNNIFEVELPLEKDKYEFKFIVDGEWKCSSFYPQIKDNRGINNNCFDNTNSENINLFNKIINFDSNVKEKNENLKEKNNSQILRGNIEDLKKIYTNLYPYEDQLNQEAPKTPDVFEILIDLNDNTNQKYFGNKQYLHFPFINLDKSFKNILPPFHSYLNHLFTYSNIKLNEDNKDNNSYLNKKTQKKNYFGINCSIKIKKKYISIVYYSPLNKT